jgi:hypothetical protein
LKLWDELSEALDKFDLSNVRLYVEDKNSYNETSLQQETIEKYTKDDFLKKVYMTPENFDTLISLLKNKKHYLESDLYNNRLNSQYITYYLNGGCMMAYTQRKMVGRTLCQPSL